MNRNTGREREDDLLLIADHHIQQLNQKTEPAGSAPNLKVVENAGRTDFGRTKGCLVYLQ
jgi:hypothetical protein